MDVKKNCDPFGSILLRVPSFAITICDSRFSWRPADFQATLPMSVSTMEKMGHAKTGRTEFRYSQYHPAAKHSASVARPSRRTSTLSMQLRISSSTPSFVFTVGSRCLSFSRPLCWPNFSEATFRFDLSMYSIGEGEFRGRRIEDIPTYGQSSVIVIPFRMRDSLNSCRKVGSALSSPYPVPTHSHHLESRCHSPALPIRTSNS